MPAKDRLEHLKAMREERKQTKSMTGDSRSMTPMSHRNQFNASLPKAVSSERAHSSLEFRSNNDTSGLQSNTSAAAPSATLRGYQKGLAGPKYKKDPTPLIPVPSDAREASKDLWATMAQQTQYDYENKQLREKKEHAAKMAEQRQMLDAQVALRAERRAAEKSAHLAERPVVDKAHEEWLAENEAKRVKRAHQVAVIGADRANQIDQRNVRKAQEVEQHKAADRAILDNIALMASHARKRQEDLKQRKVEMKEELIAANEDLKRRLEGIKAQEQALERDVVESMRQREIRDHEKRVREAELYNEKVKGREAMVMKLQATMEQRSAEDEERANRVANEREAQAIEKQRLINEKKARDKETVLAVRSLQVEAHRIAREEAEAAKQVERRELTDLYKRELQKLQQEHQRERAKLSAQRELFDSQVHERNQYHSVMVSSEEKKINAKLLERAERDKSRHTPLPFTAPTRDSGYKNRESATRIY